MIVQLRSGFSRKMSDKSEQKVRSKRNPVDLRYEHSHGDRDGILNIYDSSHPYVLLSFGAPGPDLLQMCTENFSVATEHLMVCTVCLEWPV